MRLIDADALKEKAFFHEIDNVSYVEEEDIDNAPTVNAVERKKGKWVPDVAYYDEDGCPCIVSRCSECGEAYPESNFCPNCGADMRGESNG